MKDGTIAVSGSLEDIIKADPEMYDEIKQVSAAGWDNEKAESAEEVRTMLKRNISIVSAGLFCLTFELTDFHVILSLPTSR